MVPEVMSQGEIDALLSALSSGSVDIDAINEEKKERAVKLYDFRRPDKFSKDQLRAIQMIHEAFSRQMTTALSTMVRSMVGAEVVSVDQIAYDEFVRSLVQPTSIAVLEMYPLTGNAVMEMTPQLVFAIIDRLLGGKGEPLRKVRELTDIERTVIERVYMRLLELLEESWSTVVDVRFRYDSLESNPFFVQICPGTDMVLLVTLKVDLGEVEGIVNLCIPHLVMEPFMDKLSSQQWFASTGRKSIQGSREALSKRMKDVTVPLALELGHTVLSLQEVLELQVGDVIRLEGTTKDDLGLRVGNKVKFLAQPGRHNDNYAARIVSVEQEEEYEEEE